jgi:hypothetical protein
MSIILPITDHGENKKNLCNNDNTHIADRWDLKAWDKIQNSSLSISFSNSWTLVSSLCVYYFSLLMITFVLFLIWFKIWSLLEESMILPTIFTGEYANILPSSLIGVGP